MLLHRVRRRMCAAVISSLILCFLPAVSYGATEDLGHDTIFLFSIEDCTALRQSFRQSDLSAFFNDPQVAPILERISTGVAELIEFAEANALSAFEADSVEEAGDHGVGGGSPGGETGAGGDPKEASGPDQAAVEAKRALASDVFSTLKQYASTLFKDVSGRFAVSIGYRQLADGRFEIDVLLHFQGGEQFQAQHDRIFELLARTPDKPSIERFEIAGVPFQAAIPRPEEVGGPVAPPEGLFIGHQGNNYYIGMNRTGLQEYLTTGAAKTAVVGTRLGGDPAYQQAVKSAGRGQLNVLVNMKPIWKLVHSYLPRGALPVDVHGILDEMGIFEFLNIYASMSFQADGEGTNAFIACGADKGLLRILPGAGASVSMPPYAPRTAANSAVYALRLSGLLDMVLDAVKKFAGPEAHSEAQANLAQFGAELGVTIHSLVQNLEGTTFFCQTAPAALGTNLMNPRGAFGNFLLGLKVKDRAPYDALLAGLAKHPEIGANVATEDHNGLTLYKYVEGGDSGMPEEYNVGQPVPAVVVHNDWLLFGMSEKVLKRAIATATTAAADQLGADPQYLEHLKRHGGPIAGIRYVDVSASLESVADMVRLALGFAPMYAGAAYGVPGVGKLLSSENVPPNAVFKRYFGRSSSATSRVEGGISITSWSPKVTRAAAPAPAGK